MSNCRFEGFLSRGLPLPPFLWLFAYLSSRITEMPPRATAGKDLGLHQLISSVQVGPQRGFGSSQKQMPTLHQKLRIRAQKGPRERRGGSRIEEEPGEEEEEKGEGSLPHCSCSLGLALAQMGQVL